MSISEMTALVTELQEYKRIIDEAKAAAEALTERIKAEMGETEALIVGPYRLTCKQTVRHTIDGKRLAADHPDIAAEYTNETVTRTLRVA